MEHIDADPTQKVANALAANCATLEHIIAELSAKAPTPVRPEEEQELVQDEAENLGRYDFTGTGKTSPSRRRSSSQSSPEQRGRSSSI